MSVSYTFIEKSLFTSFYFSAGAFRLITLSILIFGLKEKGDYLQLDQKKKKKNRRINVDEEHFIKSYFFLFLLLLTSPENRDKMR